MTAPTLAVVLVGLLVSLGALGAAAWVFLTEWLEPRYVPWATARALGIPREEAQAAYERAKSEGRI